MSSFGTSTQGKEFIENSRKKLRDSTHPERQIVEKRKVKTGRICKPVLGVANELQRIVK